MKARLWSLFVSLILIALLLNVSAGAGALAGPRPAANAPAAGAPTIVSYQGRVSVSSAPFNGTGYFKFAIVDSGGTTSYWSNDGTSTGGGEPVSSVALTVAGGLFTVLLGDISLPGMTQRLDAGVFAGTQRYLRVWFSADGTTFTLLAPDRRVASVPYALQALNSDQLDGLEASAFQQHYAGVVVTAKSGGDYTSVQAAIDSITAASATNPYLVWIAPGVYTETVTMKPYVDLQGAGQGVTVISSAAHDASWPPLQATLTLTRNASLRDLGVRNTAIAASSYRLALRGGAGVTQTLVADVTVQATGTGGSGTQNAAIGLYGPGASATFERVTALAQNSGGMNTGLEDNFAATTLHGGSFTGSGGINAYGIHSTGSGATLVAEDVAALGQSGTSNTYGLCNASGTATLRGGSFTARGGAYAYGVSSAGSVATLTADDVTVLGQSGTSYTYGLDNESGATATLNGGSFTARGGSTTFGIYSIDSGTTLAADGVSALGEDGTGYNYGLDNSSATATLHGGSFTGRGGSVTYGIYNNASGATLVGYSVSTLGENGTSGNYGLDNYNSTSATLHGGSFTARGGAAARAILNYGAGTTLTADSIAAVAQGGSAANYGLDGEANTTATVTQSTLEGATAAAILYGTGGSITLSNSRLVGGAAVGSVSCTLVSRGTNVNSGTTCP